MKSVITAFTLLFCAVTAGAEEMGKIPYAMLHEVFARAAKVKNPNLRAVAVFVPRPGVEPRDVTLIIQAKKGSIKVELDPDGEIRSFPMNDELLKENPFILTNQPKGTSELNVSIGIVVQNSLTYSYRQLHDLLEQANAEIMKQGGTPSPVAPKVKALLFQFEKPDKATLTIAAKGGPQILTANDETGIRLTMDNNLVSEDPKLTVSEKPRRIIVASDE